jgi:hypothetical protein
VKIFIVQGAATGSRIVRGLGVGLCLILAASSTCSAQQCVGDCNGDGRVTVDEILRGVRFSICTENVCPPPCPAFDPDNVGQVTITTLIKAINNALNGYPAKGLAGISAACTLEYKGNPYAPPNMVDLTLIVINASGVTITGVTPLEPLDVQGGPFTVLDSPSSQVQLLDGQKVVFIWRLMSTASLVVNAGAIGTGPDGEIQIGPVVCRTR